ncbi:MAG: hypothetical protein DSY47_07110 [Hydrogenothermus sp.]|nr:MAG: hypothetical protein DSY47_07110 [Hydrogenothermus sp.]
MTITIVGGIHKLKKDYEKICKEKNLKPKFILDKHPNLRDILKNSDAIVIITSNINHNTAKTAKAVSKERGIPLFLCHKGSISSLRKILEDCENCIHKNQCKFYSISKNINDA